MVAKLFVYLSGEDRDRVAAAAKKERIALSAYCRSAIMSRVERGELEAKPVNLFGGEEAEA
ncbi:MAG TPA: hypothetical protein VFH17_08395 [Coriobacteriia bacterium]|nr:hypothetical protein [Coriobacteriia bacterium]